MESGAALAEGGQSGDEAGIVVAGAVVFDQPEPAVFLLVGGTGRDDSGNLGAPTPIAGRSRTVLSQLVPFEAAIGGGKRIEQFVFEHRAVSAVVELPVEEVVAVEFVVDENGRTGVLGVRRDDADEVVLGAGDAAGAVHRAFDQDFLLAELIAGAAAVDADFAVESEEELVRWKPDEEADARRPWRGRARSL